MIVTSVPTTDRTTENSSFLTSHHPKPMNSESNGLRPPDIPERIPIRSRTSSGQPVFSPERPPSRNTPAASSVRITSTSVEKISSNNETKPMIHHDFEVDRSPLLNHSVQIDKSQLAKTRPRQLPSKRLSNPLLDEATNHRIEEIEIKISNGKEQSTSMNLVFRRRELISIGFLEVPTSTNNTVVNEVKFNIESRDYLKNDFFCLTKFVEVKDWTSDQCIQWLTAQEMTSFIPIFLNRNIDGEKLLLLDSTKMKVCVLLNTKNSSICLSRQWE